MQQHRAAFGIEKAGLVVAALVCAVALAVVLAVVLTAPSATLMVAALAAAGAATFFLVMRQVRRPLLAALFLLAPVDISKAVIAPLADRYFAVGPYYSPGLYLSLAHVALLALVVVWLGRRALLEHRWPPMTRLDAFAFAYIAYIWVRSIGAAQGVLSLGSAASYSLAVLAFYVASHAIEDAADMRLVIRASLVALFIVFCYVALQSVTQSPLPLPGSKALTAGTSVDFGGEASVFRPSGFMNHPNSLAHYLVVLIPPAFALALLGPRRIPSHVWWMAVVTIAAAGSMLLVTLSRGGWASMLLGVLVVVVVYVYRGLVTRRQLGLAAIAVVLGSIALVIVYPDILLRLTAPDNRSLESRVLLADMAFTIIEANPFAGVGFGDYNRAAFAYSAPLFATVSADYQLALHQLVVHNHFLLIAAELGIPAMLLFVYLLWRFARLPYPLKRWRDPAAFAMAVGLSASVVGEALFLNSDNYYADIRVFLFWLAAGVLQALTLQADKKAHA